VINAGPVVDRAWDTGATAPPTAANPAEIRRFFDSRRQTIAGMLNVAFTMTRQGGETKITHFGHDSNQDSSPRGFIKKR
jgi:hypothetical protein